MARSLLLHPAAKPVVFTVCLVPLAWLIFGAVADRLGANPAEALIRASGDWTLRFLCLVLAVTPLRVMTPTLRSRPRTIPFPPAESTWSSSRRSVAVPTITGLTVG